jgi:hypothetical protein
MKNSRTYLFYEDFIIRDPQPGIPGTGNDRTREVRARCMPNARGEWIGWIKISLLCNEK